MIFARGLGHCIGGMQHHFWASRYDSNWCSVCVSNMGSVRPGPARRKARPPSDGNSALAKPCSALFGSASNASRDSTTPFRTMAPGKRVRDTGITASVRPFPSPTRSDDSPAGRSISTIIPNLERTVDFPINCFLPPDRVVNFADCGKHFPDGMAFRKFALEYDNRAAAYFDRLTTERRPSHQTGGASLGRVRDRSGTPRPSPPVGLLSRCRLVRHARVMGGSRRPGPGVEDRRDGRAPRPRRRRKLYYPRRPEDRRARTGHRALRGPRPNGSSNRPTVTICRSSTGRVNPMNDVSSES